MANKGCSRAGQRHLAAGEIRDAGGLRTQGHHPGRDERVGVGIDEAAWLTSGSRSVSPERLSVNLEVTTCNNTCQTVFVGEVNYGPRDQRSDYREHGRLMGRQAPRELSPFVRRLRRESKHAPT